MRAALSAPAPFRSAAKLRSALDACPAQDLAANASVEASLAEGDCTIGALADIPDPAFADVYRVEMPAKGVLTLIAEAQDYRPQLILLDAGGGFLGMVTGKADDKAAQLIISLDAGVYTLIATGVGEAVGPYKLTSASEQPRSCTPREIAAGKEVEGTLDPAGCRVLDYTLFETDAALADAYTLKVEQRSVLTLEMSRCGFDGPSLRARWFSAQRRFRRRRRKRCALDHECRAGDLHHLCPCTYRRRRLPVQSVRGRAPAMPAA
jgi:hypothetical protein